jgi:hypothetical protein
MSLKAFHLVFLFSCIVLLLFLSGWCFSNYRNGGQQSELVFAGIGLGVALGLMLYTRYFLKKLKGISYL